MGGVQNSLWGKKTDKATKQLKGYKTVRRGQQNRWGGGGKNNQKNGFLGKNSKGKKKVGGEQNRLRAKKTNESYRGQQNQLMTTKQYEYKGNRTV